VFGAGEQGEDVRLNVGHPSLSWRFRVVAGGALGASPGPSF
jgi:hypothetical protein